MASALLNVSMPVRTSPASKQDIVRIYNGRGSSSRLVVRAKDASLHMQGKNREPKQQQLQQRASTRFSPLGVIWDPFQSPKSVRQMVDAVERMLDDTQMDSSPSRPSVGVKGGRSPWDIVEKENEVRMRFDMPGVPKQAVQVSVEEDVLVIKAEHPIEEKEEERWSNRSYGKYNTRIVLPDNCRIEDINAELKDGVLYVTVPKAKEEPKVVNINVN